MPPAVLARPLTREAARKAGVGLAQQAAKVYRAVLQGPEAEPAGYGVEVPRFVQALPYLTHEQLVQCSSHFGQRGRAVGSVASAVASEISWRVRPQGGEALEDMEDSVPSRLKQSWRADEVTTVLYAFSKVTPQLPEYQVLYEAVSDGLLVGLWSLNHLQSVLIATALADTETRLSDALPAVLQPLLAELVESAQVREEISLDTLRFLIHAAASLPNPGLTGKEVEALADCTLLRLNGSTFATQAHMLVSWLRLAPPPSAKEAYFKALQACCQALQKHKKSHMPAHPLPREGLAPVIDDVLAREAEQNAPPLTPPIMESIVKGLVQISWGLLRNQHSQAAKSRSLSIDDWSDIMSKLVKYCESHSIVGKATTTSSSSSHTLTLSPPSLLPNWAAGALYHVLWRAQRQQIPRNSPKEWVQLSSLRALLTLLRRYKNIEPEEEFFAWSVRLVDLHQRAGGVEESLFAEVVTELVPLLPEEERVKLTRVIMARPQEGPEAKPVMAAIPLIGAAQQPQRLLRSSEDEASDVKVVLAPAVHQQPVPAGTGSAAFAARMAAGGRLWGLLAAQTQGAKPSPEAAQAKPEAEMATVLAREETAAEQPADAALGEAASSALPHAIATPASSATVEELQRMLQSALLRVEALESRLADQERDVAKAKEDCEAPSDDLQHNMSESSGNSWFTQILEPAAEQIQPSPAAATLHLRRAFNFEQFRRANSARLDTERLRVIVPPDHFPLWPLTKR